MDASSTTVTEFIQQAKAYCLAKDKKAITGWENYLGSVQKADVKFQFQLFLEVISCSFSSHNEVGLLAAQSLRGLCRRGQVGDDHLQAMVHLLRKMSIANKSHSCQLIVTQIVLAVGACFVMRTATELCNIPPSNHIDSAVHMMKQWLEYMQHQQIDTKLQVQVLSAIPEHCEYKDLKSALPVKGPQQVIYIKSVQSALVFCASNVIELLKPVMSQYGEMNGDTAGLANYQQCIKCCSAWVKLHQTVVEAADRSQNSLVALTSLYLRWVDQDAALVRVVRSIEQLANLDLIEEIEDDYNSLLESHVEFMHNLTELLEILCKGQCVEAREMLLQSSFQVRSKPLSCIIVPD